MQSNQEGLTQLGFRQAQDTDADFLYALHVATMKEYVEKTWGWDETFQMSTYPRNHPPSETQIITLNGKDIGMISVEERNEDVFLRAIDIHPSHQRQGLGTAIIQQIIADATRRKKPVFLRVLKINPAKRLYERLGFLVIEETETHYMMKKFLSE